MYHWEYDGPALEELNSAPAECVAALADFLGALMFDPVDYQRTASEVPGKAVRMLPFGNGRGIVTFLVYGPDRLVLVTRITWFG